MADDVLAALVAELRMLSSGESSVSTSTTAAVTKPEHRATSDANHAAMQFSLLEPGRLCTEAYSDSLLVTLSRLVFGHPEEAVKETYQWRSLGYLLCSRLGSSLRSSDIFFQTLALRMMTDLSTAFLDKLSGIGSRYFDIRWYIY